MGGRSHPRKTGPLCGQVGLRRVGRCQVGLAPSGARARPDLTCRRPACRRPTCRRPTWRRSRPSHPCSMQSMDAPRHASSSLNVQVAAGLLRGVVIGGMHWAVAAAAFCTAHLAYPQVGKDRAAVVEGVRDGVMPAEINDVVSIWQIAASTVMDLVVARGGETAVDIEGQHDDSR